MHSILVFRIRSKTFQSVSFSVSYIYIYPKRLTVHSGYTFFVSICVAWESNPQTFALLMQYSTTEPQVPIIAGSKIQGLQNIISSEM